MKLVEQKIKAGGKQIPGHKKKAAPATGVVDLMEVLQKSLGTTGKAKGRKATGHRHAA